MLTLASLVGPDGAIVAVIYLAIVVAVIVGTVKIISKAGYSGWFVLLALVPLVNIVMFFVFAFSDWPVQKEIRQYRQAGYGVGPGGYPPPPWLPPPSAGYGYDAPAGYGSGPAGYGPGPAGYGSGPAQAPPSSWQPPSGAQTPPAPGGSESPEPGSATSWQAPPPPPEPAG